MTQRKVHNVLWAESTENSRTITYSEDNDNPTALISAMFLQDKRESELADLDQINANSHKKKTDKNKIMSKFEEKYFALNIWIN